MLVTHEMRFAGNELVFMHMGKVHEELPPKALFSAQDAGACGFVSSIT